jgi:hypothetical protein
MPIQKLRALTRLRISSLLNELQAVLPHAQGERPAQPLDLFQLEERVLLSASPAAVVVEAIDTAMLDADAGTASAETAEPGTAGPTGSPSAESSSASLLDQMLSAQTEATFAGGGLVDGASAAGDDTAQAVLRELVFLDTGVENYQQLLEDLWSLDDGSREIEVVLLSGQRDGVDQITEALDGRTDLDAIHIVSHGTDGRVKLGGTWLDIDNLGGYAGEIAAWGNALSADADLLFYGCDLAASEDGKLLVNSLSALTGADVAASIDDTGNAIFGADWELEYSAGQIETQIAFSQDAQDNWGHLLNVAVDATSTGSTTGSTLNIPHTTSGSNRLMLVGVSIGQDSPPSVSSITYNGSSLTSEGFVQSLDGGTVEIFSLIAPTAGTFKVNVTLSGAGNTNVGVMTFTGVDQSTPLGTFASASGDATSGTVAVSSAADELVFGVVTVNTLINENLVPGGGQTEQWDLFTGKESNGGGSIEAGAASVDMSWTWTDSTGWAIGGVSIKPVSGTSTSFQEGVASYTGTEDTTLRGQAPDTSYGTDNVVRIDLDDSGSPEHGLIRFDNIFGSGPNQIPVGSTINSASLTINVTNQSTSSAAVTLHRMLTTWEETSTWNSMVGGLQTDDVEASSTIDATLLNPKVTGTHTLTGLEATVQAWSDGATNYGWAIVMDSTNGLDFSSSEEQTIADQPQLIINFTAPVAPTISLPSGAVNYTENDPATVIDSAATVSASDSADFDTGTLTVDFTAGSTANDTLSIVTGGNVTTSGSDVRVSGTTIGTFSGGASGTPLIITWNTNSSPSTAQEVMRQIAYDNVSENPSTSARTVRFVLTDGDGETSNTETETINVSAENDVPAVSTTGSSLAYTENDIGTNIDTGLTVADPDRSM